MKALPFLIQRDRSNLLPAELTPATRSGKAKGRIRYAIPLAVLGLLLALGALSILTQSIAVAQGPEVGVHFAPVRNHSQQAGSYSPGTSTTNLTYNGGPVMLTTTTYTIFWTPPGHPLSAGYESLMNRFFADVGGSGLYNVMTQYHDASNAIQNSSTFGGTWTDTTPYPHAGTLVDPLRRDDIRASVSRALAANGWTPGSNHLFFVYTAPGMTECFDTRHCTPGTLETTYCAYHSFFTQNTQTVIYAFVPYGETWAPQCRGFSRTPNGDIAADASISMTSHELFEAITDIEPTPDGLAWYDLDCSDDTECGEVADKCEYRYGALAADGSNITLGSHRYIVQQEWSNAAFTGSSYSGCVLNYNVPTSHVFVDRAYTASNNNSRLKKNFHRGDRIFYFGTMRNDGTAACTTQGNWFAKGGTKTLVNVSDTISIEPGTEYWYVKGKIPFNAPLRKYRLTVSTNCNGQSSAASVTFKVVAGASATTSSDNSPATGPIRSK